jgi:hypothetical protein
MPLTEENSIEERNMTLRSFIEEIFNKHNLLSIEEYFGDESVESGPQAGQGGDGFRLMLTEFFKGFPDWRAEIEHAKT